MWKDFLKIVIKVFCYFFQCNSMLGFSLLLKLTLCWTFYMFGRRDKDGGITGRSQYLANLGTLSVRDRPPLWNQQRGDYQNSDISLSLSSLRGSLTGWRYRLLVDNSGKGVILDPKNTNTPWQQLSLNHRNRKLVRLTSSDCGWKRNLIISCMPLLLGVILQFPQSKVYRLGPCWLRSIISLRQLNWAGCGGERLGGKSLYNVVLVRKFWSFSASPSTEWNEMVLEMEQ